MTEVSDMMMNFIPLASEPVVIGESFGERLLYGLQITAIGMLTVFLVLLILMLILKVFGWVFAEKKIKNKKDAVTETPAQPQIQEEASEDEDEIAAVISAAVYAYMETAAPGTKYVIRSFKKIKEDN